MAADPAAESLRIIKNAGEELGKIAINDLRLRSNRVLRAVDRAADALPEYLANEVFGQTSRPGGPGWDKVVWKPLSVSTLKKKRKKPNQTSFFLDTGELIDQTLSSFKVGLAFGRAYVLVNGVRPKSHTNWSNIHIDFSDETPISMDFFPFLKAGNDFSSRNRSFAWGAALRGTSDEHFAQKIVNQPKAYRPTLEPTLIYFTKRTLKAIAENAIDQQGLY